MGLSPELNVIRGNQNTSHHLQSDTVDVRVVAWPHYLGLDGFNVYSVLCFVFPQWMCASAWICDVYCRC